jgi:RNA polymerase sigma-70 factor (ECF subfamily)
MVIQEGANLGCLSVAGKSSEVVQQREPDTSVKKISYTTAQNIKIAFKKFYKSCCQYAAEKIKDEQAAEDIVADAFLQLMQQIGRFDAAAMESELYTIIHDKCKDYKDEQRFLAEGAAAFGELTPSDKAEIQAELEAELNSLIHDELSNLPPQRKQIMLQLYMEGLTSHEVAQRMMLSRQTVLNQKGIALKMLRNNILKRLFLV